MGEGFIRAFNRTHSHLKEVPQVSVRQQALAPIAALAAVGDIPRLGADTVLPGTLGDKVIIDKATSGNGPH